MICCVRERTDRCNQVRPSSSNLRGCTNLSSLSQALLKYLAHYQAVSGYLLNDMNAVWRHKHEANAPMAISPAGMINAKNQRHLLALTLDLFASHLVGRLGSPV